MIAGWVSEWPGKAFIEGMNTTVLLTQLWNSVNGWPEGTFYRYNLLLIQLTGQLLIRRQGINEAKDLHWMPLGASYLCYILNGCRENAAGQARCSTVRAIYEEFASISLGILASQWFNLLVLCCREPMMGSWKHEFNSYIVLHHIGIL